MKTIILELSEEELELINTVKNIDQRGLLMQILAGFKQEVLKPSKFMKEALDHGDVEYVLSACFISGFIGAVKVNGLSGIEDGEEEAEEGEDQ